MRRLVILAMLAAIACAIDHHVKLLLGPNEDTVSSGFQCRVPGTGSNGPFLFSLLPLSNGMVTFNVVVDVVDLGGTFPGCLGEDVQAACNDGTADGACKLSTTVAPQRICFPVTVAANANAVQAVKAELEKDHGTLIANAPDRAVIFRVVATTEACIDVQKTTPSGDVWVPLISQPGKMGMTDNFVLGCAYSCPIVPDDAGSTIAISIGLGLVDLGSDLCIPTIDTCAVFPAKP
jgi:hypothetical protein